MTWAIILFWPIILFGIWLLYEIGYVRRRLRRGRR